MKKLLLIILLFYTTSVFGQSLWSNPNSFLTNQIPTASDKVEWQMGDEKYVEKVLK